VKTKLFEEPSFEQSKCCTLRQVTQQSWVSQPSRMEFLRVACGYLFMCKLSILVDWGEYS